jgi:hypothetical protein
MAASARKRVSRSRPTVSGLALLGAVLLGAVLLGVSSGAVFADEGTHPAPPTSTAPATAAVLASSPIVSAPGQTAAPRSSRPLDLSAPPISHVMTREQVQELTAEHDEPVPAEDVMIESPHYEAPVPRGQIRALSWALLHPLEAWRILAPVTDQ